MAIGFNFERDDVDCDSYSGPLGSHFSDREEESFERSLGSHLHSHNDESFGFGLDEDDEEDEK